jgi:hypothetical protein
MIIPPYRTVFRNVTTQLALEMEVPVGHVIKDFRAFEHRYGPMAIVAFYLARHYLTLRYKPDEVAEKMWSYFTTDVLLSRNRKTSLRELNVAPFIDHYSIEIESVPGVHLVPTVESNGYAWDLESA